METASLMRAALVRFGGGAVVLGAVFFGTAGTFRYWEAWAFLGTVFIPVAVVLAYLARRDPELLERRLRYREERRQQRPVIVVGSLLWLLTYLMPGLDHRFGWSSVPVWLVIVADVLVLTGYGIFVLTIRENSFAGRTVRIDEGQSVITTGPYAVVRHPMYVGVGLMLLVTPLALGSWWAMIPNLLTPLFLVLRIRDEEAALREELPGYGEYVQTTRYRMIPGVW